MKILIHSNAPWVGSGYGKQTRLLIPRLIKDGHDVVISAINGLHGGEIEWVGNEPGDAQQPVKILPAAQYNFGVDTLPAYIADEQPDLVLTVMDCRMLGPIAQQLQDAPLACWVPGDTAPLSKPERAFLEASQATPIAMTRWGVEQLIGAGFPENVAYIPHGVDTAVFTRPGVRDDGLVPYGGQEQCREMLGIPTDAFVIGMVAANSDAVRKGFPEQFEAFRRLRAHNEKAHLVVHTVAKSSANWNLEDLALEIGIADDVSFSQPLPQLTGRIGDDHMVKLYRSFDILSMCSYGEGFGVPMIEAMACGTPLVVTDFGAMREVGHPAAFLAHGEPFWNPVHKSWWQRPDIASIAEGYNHFAQIHGRPAFFNLQQRAREQACHYDADVVYNDCWRPFLNAWEATKR